MSRKELQELVHAGVLTHEEVEEVISIEFNPESDYDRLHMSVHPLIPMFDCYT